MAYSARWIRPAAGLSPIDTRLKRMAYSTSVHLEGGERDGIDGRFRLLTKRRHEDHGIWARSIATWLTKMMSPTCPNDGFN